MSEDDHDDYERGYVEGKRRVTINLLRELGLMLPFDDLGEALRRVLDLERERMEAVAALRAACADYGDNDWSDNLHLRDVIEKHLVCYFESEEEDE